ncbi:PEP/pyruvate-binding domain-containing protein [Streptosporangium saharense]|uniref:Pyruvate,water dikinase n=1 Tax=Streptosporangium saharense TaxID=1706840 RepID=A0A7W7QJM0_9ACTN|nr:PEP/pyruvate-binding domain-containing protein [Streptosporangium saharense]MBB4914733.1 pyruvate,water dikinase [Streptosporangium saharense]
MPASPLILPFSAIGAEALALVGGKAVNLGVLTGAGFPVPPGVCLTTRAYQAATEGAGLDEVLDALAAAPAGDVTALNDLAARARDLVLAAPVPQDVADAVRHGPTGPVAVRSSATAEDLPHASFAGQQDTYLNVVGEEAVLDAVRRCWASLWTDRAVAYRAANGIDHRTVLLAVVIQEMVCSEVAGVMFTANPVTGRRHEAVIDASPGLGEAVVSGSVNPDHFVVDIATGRITERRPGDKLLAVRPLPGGGVERVGLGDGTERACVTDDQLRALARLGGRVEEHYGSPQDTEWAVDADGELWLTQSRPITTLFPVPESAAARAEGGPRVYFSFSVAQGVYAPFTPMGVSAFRLLSSSVSALAGNPVADVTAGAPQVTEAAGRLFFDVTGVMRGRAGRTIVPRLLDVMEARSAVVLRGLFDDPRFGVTRRSVLPALRRLLRIARRFRVPSNVVRAVLNPAATHERLGRLRARLRAELAPLPETATPLERLDRVERTLSARTVPLLPRVVPGPIAGFAMLGLAARLLGDRARPGELTTVLRGLPYNVTTEMDLALWALADRIRADADASALLLATPAAELARRFHDGSLPGTVQRGLREFLAVYGVRAVAEIDLGVARWSEDPTHVIGVLTNYLRLDDRSQAPDAVFARGAAEATRMIRTLAARAGGPRGALVRFALGRARALAGLRELPKFVAVTVLAAMRAELRIVGADLVSRDVLDSPDDVFFLTVGEVRTLLSAPDDSRALVAERRDRAERERRRRRLPRVVLSDGTEPEAVGTAAPVDGALTGTPASAGTVTGVARVVLDPVGARLEPGEILVCPSTDPGWTPLFLTAGGLVMEMGGANSHGAVVAREYGIPAVVGVADATEHVVTGQRITVDGTSGTVSTVGVASEEGQPRVP